MVVLGGTRHHGFEFYSTEPWLYVLRIVLVYDWRQIYVILKSLNMLSCSEVAECGRMMNVFGGTRHQECHGRRYWLKWEMRRQSVFYESVNLREIFKLLSCSEFTECGRRIEFLGGTRHYAKWGQSSAQTCRQDAIVAYMNSRFVSKSCRKRWKCYGQLTVENVLFSNPWNCWVAPRSQSVVEGWTFWRGQDIGPDADKWVPKHAGRMRLLDIWTVGLGQNRAKSVKSAMESWLLKMHFSRILETVGLLRVRIVW